MTQEDEKIETCRTAMKAALEAIQDYCGTGEPKSENYIIFAGEKIEYPDSVQEIIDYWTSRAPPETQSEGAVQTERLAATPWAEEIATEQCRGMYSENLPEFDECIKRVSMDLAREVIFQRLKRGKGDYYFSFPDEIYELATSNKTVNERIRDVKNHGWTGEQANKICSKRYLPEGSMQECVGNEADVIARGIVANTKADGRVEAERKYAEAYAEIFE